MEFLDIINVDGIPAGYYLSRNDVHKKGLWHRTVHIWILNSNKDLLLQKRSIKKEVYPGLWDISCAGHLTAGDTSYSGAVRELKEELGLDINTSELKFLFTVTQHYCSSDNSFVDNELTDVYLLRKDIDISSLVIDKDEVEDVRFMSVFELKKSVLAKSPLLAPHEPEYRLLFDYLSEE